MPPHHAEAVPTATRTTATRGSIAGRRSKERRRSMILLSGTTPSSYPCSHRRRRRGAIDAIIAITLDTHRHAVPAVQADAAGLMAGLVFAG
jgi:hypothetical protein